MMKTAEERPQILTATSQVRTHGRKRKPAYFKALDENVRVPRADVEMVKELLEQPKPTTREDCRDRIRPCLHVRCKWHLFLDVNPETGSIKFNFPNKEIWELDETCALDVAERGGITLEEVGALFNLTRERIRQVETHGLDKLKRRLMHELSPLHNLLALRVQSNGDILLPEITLSPEDYRAVHIFKEIIQAGAAA